VGLRVDGAHLASPPLQSRSAPSAHDVRSPPGSPIPPTESIPRSPYKFNTSHFLTLRLSERPLKNPPEPTLPWRPFTTRPRLSPAKPLSAARSLPSPALRRNRTSRILKPLEWVGAIPTPFRAGLIDKTGCSVYLKSNAANGGSCAPAKHNRGPSWQRPAQPRKNARKSSQARQVTTPQLKATINRCSITGA